MTKSQDNAKWKIHIKAKISCKCNRRYTPSLKKYVKKKFNVILVSNYSINQCLISTIQNEKTWGKHDTQARARAHTHTQTIILTDQLKHIKIYLELTCNRIRVTVTVGG